MGKSKGLRKKSRVNDGQEKLDVLKEEHVETINVRIKTVAENPDEKTAPLVGYFPSGYDPLKISGNPDARPKSSVKIYQSAHPRNPQKPRMQLVVDVEQSELNFVGTNYSGEAGRPQLCNYALGVLDKETGVLKMVPIASNRIFRLEPQIGSLEQHENEPAEEEITAETRSDKYKNLVYNYSTKKNIRTIMKYDALNQTENPETQAELDSKLKEIKINEDAYTVSMTNARNVPPYDLSATTPDMAYPLNKIILEGEWDYLVDVFELVQNGLDVNPDVYPSFVCNRVHKLNDVKDEFDQRKMAGILSYVTHLIRFKDKSSMDGVVFATHHKFPSIFAQKFSSLFGSKDERISPEKQKLLISYILVLSLFADNFRSVPTDIAKDLRMNAVALRPHYEYLGCKLVRDKEVLVATLPIPLEFPSFTRRRKR